MSTTPFETAITCFVFNLQKKMDEYMEKNYPKLAKVEMSIMRGEKFVRVVKKDGSSRSAYCFVAIADGSNRTLGSWKAGDILKNAGWAGPAKGARGNIFSENPLSPCGPHGIAYNNGSPISQFE